MPSRELRDSGTPSGRRSSRGILAALCLPLCLALGAPLLSGCAVVAGAVGGYVIYKGMVDDWQVAHTTYQVDEAWQATLGVLDDISAERLRVIDFPREAAAVIEDYEIVGVVLAEDLDHTIIQVRADKDDLEDPDKAEEVLEQILAALAPQS